MAKLEVLDVSKYYYVGSHKKQVLQGINFRIHAGEFVCIVGPSGCGKTTLLKIIDGLVQPSGGEIRIDGGISVHPGRDKGFVFQDLALFPWLTALQNVQFALQCQAFPQNDIEERSRQYLMLVGLDTYGNYYPSQLSGGMNQRVALARALSYDPQILLLDEPFAALDAFTRSKLQEELLRIWKKTRKTILFVTHNIEEAVFLGQRVIVLSGNPGEVKKDLSVGLKKSNLTHLRTSADFNRQRRIIEDLIV